MAFALTMVNLGEGDFISSFSQDFEDAVGRIESSSVAVFDNYVSDGPGYVGPVYVAVYSEPSFIDVYEENRTGDGLEVINVEGREV